MSFYSKFSEKDLIESYKEQIDYQGKASKEIVEEIVKRGSLEDFHAKIENQNLIRNERNRIIRDIHKNYMNKISMQECLLLIKSDLVSNEDMQFLVEQKYNQIHQNIENLKVDSKTLINSFIGTMVSSVFSTAVLIILLYKFNFLAAFNFALLIPLYVINYWIIRLITGKTRHNLAVFISAFLATVLNCVYTFLIL